MYERKGSPAWVLPGVLGQAEEKRQRGFGDPLVVLENVHARSLRQRHGHARPRTGTGQVREHAVDVDRVPLEATRGLQRHADVGQASLGPERAVRLTLDRAGEGRLRHVQRFRDEEIVEPEGAGRDPLGVRP